MLLSSEIILKKKNNSNLEYYKSLGYDVQSDEFTIKIEHLLKNSSALVKVSCDYCGNVDEIPFIKWNRSMESSVKKYACSNKCKGEKIKESNLINYGVTSVAKLESSKEKSKLTCLENWGVEVAFKSDLVKEKIKQSNLEKWGVDCVLKNSEIRNRIKNTNIEKWGVDNVSKLDEIKKQKKQTTFSNWGVEIPLQSDLLKEKSKQTNFLRHGKDYSTQTEEYRRKNYDIANDPHYLEYEYICSVYNGEVVKTFRDGKMEIDIYIPELKIGFEFNGLYWHSEEHKDSNFHLKKTEYFASKEIRIFHIWEDDWDFKREIIQSQINNLLNLNTKKIFARKCQVKLIDDIKLVKKFLTENHIQGYVNSVIKIGLFYNDELVSLMCFDKFEGRKKMVGDEWNLNRFCTIKGFTIVGGASKLFSFFIKKLNPKRVVSYADRDWSIGNVYYKLGFNLLSISRPDYKYIVDNKRVNKSRFRKSRTGLTESKLNLFKIWDCGKMKFEILY